MKMASGSWLSWMSNERELEPDQALLMVRNASVPQMHPMGS